MLPEQHAHVWQKKEQMNCVLSMKQVDEFLAALADQEKSRNTIAKYRRDTMHFLDFCRGTGEKNAECPKEKKEEQKEQRRIEKTEKQKEEREKEPREKQEGKEERAVEVTRSLVLEYKTVLLRQYKISSVNSMLSSLNSFFAFLKMPDLRFRLVKAQKQMFAREEKNLTRKEYTKLVHTAMQSGQERTCMILQTLASTAVRISELPYITVEALQKGSIQTMGKGRKFRTVLLVDELQELLLDYCRKHHISSGSIFRTRTGKTMDRSNIWRDMKALCCAAGVEPSKVFPHNFRHLFAKLFYEIDKDISKLADILGHDNLNTTRIYLLDSLSEHRKIMEQMKLVENGKTAGKPGKKR